MNSIKILSVICPVYNEQKYINNCIESILTQDFPLEHLEVLFIDGMSSDNTREIINSFARKFNFVKLLDNPDNIVPHALNIGIKASVGDIIIRIDAHCDYPNNYFSSMIYYLNNLKADNVGGSIITKPANSSTIAKAIAIALSHPFGVGDSFFRIGCKKIKAVDTVPFGCFRRTLFDRIGFFDIDLVRNQDDEFNARIIKNGGRIFLIPNIEINYYSREQVSKVRQMFYQYGLFKPLVNRKIGAAATLRQFIPMLFIFGTIISAFIGMFIKPSLIIGFSLVIFYIILSLSFSTIEAIRQKKIQHLYLLPYVFLILHISYGWGYIIGVIRFLVLRKNGPSVSDNR